MKKILVTGANGYLGARLCKNFAENGYEVTGLCYPEKPNNSEWTNLLKYVIVGDVRSEEVIKELVKEKYDVVLHLVSLDHHQSENIPNFVSSVNVLPTWNLLDAFSKNRNLEKFIYFSTFQVYGKVPLIEITEDFTPSPQNTYGLTHLLSENICSLYNNKTDIDCINVRLSNSYGSPVFQENNCWWLVINDLCKTAYNEKKIRLLSDGSPQRDFIHSTDVYNAIEILINAKKKYFQNNIYHISFGTTLTILELAHTVKNIYQDRYQKEIHVYLSDNSISENSDKFSKAERYIVNNSKLESLGFLVKTDLRTGINETFEYLEEFHDTKK